MKYLKGSMRYCVVALIVISFSGCAIHYKNAPDQLVSPGSYSPSGKTYFKVFDRPIVSSDGPETIVEVLKSHSFYENAVQVYDDTIPSDGIYVEVNPQYQTPSFPALAFGYLSLSTLTLLPAWSNDDGFDVLFSVYENGVLKDTYVYETRRFLATWLGLLPFIWVNLLTEDEAYTFEAITKQFLLDSEPLLSN